MDVFDFFFRLFDRIGKTARNLIFKILLFFDAAPFSIDSRSSIPRSPSFFFDVPLKECNLKPRYDRRHFIAHNLKSAFQLAPIIDLSGTGDERQCRKKVFLHERPCYDIIAERFRLLADQIAKLCFRPLKVKLFYKKRPVFFFD
jgi:hypothetical protein